MKKDSFILYNSFYDSIKTLKNEQLGKLLRAIFNYTTNGEITQEEDILIAFMFIKNQLDLDNKKWQDIKEKRSEAGKKHKGNQYTKWNKMEQNGTNGSVNVNENDNVNVNENDNVFISNTTNNIYDFLEQNFNRTISPLEVTKIDNWLKEYDEDIIKYAIEKSVMSNAKTFNYINGILNNWKSVGYKTLKEIKENEKTRKETNIEKKELFDYDWLNESEE